MFKKILLVMIVLVVMPMVLMAASVLQTQVIASHASHPQVNMITNDQSPPSTLSNAATPNLPQSIQSDWMANPLYEVINSESAATLSPPKFMGHDDYAILTNQTSVTSSSPPASETQNDAMLTGPTTALSTKTNESTAAPPTPTIAKMVLIKEALGVRSEDMASIAPIVTSGLQETGAQNALFAKLSPFTSSLNGSSFTTG